MRLSLASLSGLLAFLIVAGCSCGPSAQTSGNLVLEVQNVHTDMTPLPASVGGGFVFSGDVQVFAGGLGAKATVEPGKSRYFTFAGCPKEIIVILPQAPVPNGAPTVGGARLYRKGTFPYVGDRLLVRFP